MPWPVSWPCKKLLKPNCQSVVTETNKACSLLSFILAQLLLLDMDYKNIFAFFKVSALTAGSGMSFFFEKVC